MNAKCPRDELLAALAADGLSPDEERELQAHLETCAVCREARDQNDDVRRVLRALPLPRPREAARERAYGSVLEAMSRGKGGTGVARNAAAPPAPALATRRPFLRVVGALAAGVCAVAMAGLYVVAPREAAYERSAPLAKASPEAAARREQDANVSKTNEETAQRPATPPPAPPSADSLDKPRDAEAPAKPSSPSEDGALAAGKPPAPAPGGAPAPAPPADRALERFAREAARKKVLDSLERGDLAMTRAALLSVAHERVLEGLLPARARGNFPQEPEAEKAKGGAKDEAPAPAPPARKQDEGKESKPDDFKSQPQAGAAPRTAELKKAFAAPKDADAPQTVGDFDTEPPGANVLRVTQRADGTDARAQWVARLEDKSGANGADFARRAGSTAAVASLSAVALDDPAQRERLLQILDRELARTPQDLAWAKRVIALARALGVDTAERPTQPGPAEAAESPAAKPAPVSPEDKGGK